MDKVIEFKKVIPITKAYEDDGELYIEGESSGPELDLDRQFMTPGCIKGMADQVNRSPVPYLDEHQKRGVASELGMVIAAGITPEYHLRTKTRLDRDNPIAVTLWTKVQKGKKFGQSIAGHIAKLATKVIDGVVYKGFDQIVLDHIANTTKPSWAPSLGTLVAKSLEDDGFDWADVSEYDGELPFSANVEKGSKADPQAGKWYVLAEDILKRLNQVFGWESYQDRIAETNRDNIPLKDLPIAQTLPVGAVELSADDYDNDPQGYVEKMMGGMEPEGPQQAMDVRQMAELYERLYWIAESLQRRDERNGTKDGKKTVTRLKAAMSAVADALKEMLSKSQPEPLSGEPVEPPTQSAMPEQPMQEVTSMLGDNMLKTFAQANAVGQVSEPLPQQPQPPVAAGVLTDFSQVGQEPAPVAKAAPDSLDQLLVEFEEAVKKAHIAEAPVDTKRQALGHIVKAFVQELDGRLETQRPEEDRIEAAVAKAIAPLQQQIEELQAQLAVAKSRPAQGLEDGEERLVRKSLPGKMVLQPARVVQKSDQRPTFVDLVTGQGGLLP